MDALTPAHQQAIPGIVAAAQAARQSKIEAWKAEHGQPVSIGYRCATAMPSFLSSSMTLSLPTRCPVPTMTR